MRTILLSFSYEWFQYIDSGKMNFDYRKVLPVEETRVFFYVSRPVMAITGMAHFGPRENLKDWLDMYGDRSEIVRSRILGYMTDCRYAVKIYDYCQTNRVSLQELREKVPGFKPPRMYYYIDGTPLIVYLENNLKPSGKKWSFSFDQILDEDICNILGQNKDNRSDI